MRFNNNCNTYTSNLDHNIEMWKQIEYTIKDNLMQFDNARKFCAYCGQVEVISNENGIEEKIVSLGRCYGCQMVYYCKQEHQHLDWLENHMPKCAELEWVALCELIQSFPVNLPLTDLGMFWQDRSIISTWSDWFEIREEIVQTVHQIAKTFEHNIINRSQIIGLNKFNRREPSFTDLVDGLLASVTDSMTFALTIGDALIKSGIDPNIKPICIHLVSPPNELLEDFVYFYNKGQSDVENIIKRKFYELCNMFPYNRGFEIVFIASNTVIDSSNQLTDWSKMIQAPFMKAELQHSLPLNNKNLFISAWQGTYSNYIKYACQIEGYSQPDLVVSFHPNFTSSPHKLITEWTDDLKVILTNNFTCLFTFYDKDEKQKAYMALNAFQTNFISIQSNQFSSLMLKQMSTRPNHVYAANSFYMIVKGFQIDVDLDSRFIKIDQIINSNNFSTGIFFWQFLIFIFQFNFR